MKNRTSIIAAAFCALLVPSTVWAQPGYGGPRYRDHGPRDHRGRGEHIGRVIADCEERTNQFQYSLRRALEYSGLRDTHREDELNRDANRLEHSLNRVREAWNRDRDMERARDHVGSAIQAARDINRTMMRRRLNPDVQRQWFVVRGELNRMAEVFELPRIGW